MGVLDQIIVELCLIVLMKRLNLIHYLWRWLNQNVIQLYRLRWTFFFLLAASLAKEFDSIGHSGMFDTPWKCSDPIRHSGPHCRDISCQPVGALCRSTNPLNNSCRSIPLDVHIFVKIYKRRSASKIKVIISLYSPLPSPWSFCYSSVY